MKRRYGTVGALTVAFLPSHFLPSFFYRRLLRRNHALLRCRNLPRRPATASTTAPRHDKTRYQQGEARLVAAEDGSHGQFRDVARQLYLARRLAGRQDDRVRALRLA